MAATDAIEDLPPSAKYVLDVLEREGALDRQALIEETTLAEGTLSDALRRLQERDLVMATSDPGDLRRRVYELADG